MSWCVCSSGLWRLVLVLVIFAPSLTAAQDLPVDVAGGYQFFKVDDRSFPAGLAIDVAAGIPGQLALVAEVGWSRGSARQFGLRDIATVIQTAGGGRWTTNRTRRATAFAQALLGVERHTVDIERFGSDSDSKVFVQPGGGMTVRVGRRQELFGQADFRRVLREDDRANALRLRAGVRFNVR